MQEQGFLPKPKQTSQPRTQILPVILENPQQQQQRKRRRNRNRKKNTLNSGGALPVQYSPAMNMNNPILPQPQGVSNGRSNMVKSMQRTTAGLTKEGVNFLKCAFSPADFDGSSTYGVPDDFGGKTLAVKHRSIQPFNFLANQDVYFLIVPIPGYAYFFATTSAGVLPVSTTVWTGVTYSNYVSLFGSGGAVNSALITNKFRFVSQHVEFVPNTNNNSWTGGFQAWKLPLQVTQRSTATTAANEFTISGLNGTAVTDADSYAGPFNLGLYTGAFNKGSSAWDFSQVVDNVQGYPPVSVASDFGVLSWDGTHNFPGFDNNFETVCIKVSGVGANTTNSVQLKTWACVEYQFVPGSLMYESQALHYTCDERALKLYREIVLNLPVGVSYLDNANFWTRVLSIIKTLSGGASYIPGPIGMISRGVNLVTGGIESLLI